MKIISRPWSILLTIILLTGCASSGRIPTSIGPNHWQGKLSLNTIAPRKSFQADFEISGSTQKGELRLFSPLGQTLAVLSWDSQSADLITQEEKRQFAKIEDLIIHTIGTDLPLETLFGWLQGQNIQAKGWQSDLSNWSDGLIRAKRIEPEARLILKVDRK